MRDYQRIFTPDMFQPSLETDPLAPACDSDREREAVVNRIVADMAAGRAHAARTAAEREQHYAAARAELEASSNGEAQTSPSGDDGSAANAQAAADAEASAGADAARIEREAAEKEYWQALDQQDSDYHAFMIDLSVRIDGAAIDGEQLGEECDLTLWELTEDKLDNLAMVADLKDAIIKAIEPWVSHYRSLGLIRSDFGAFGLDASRGEGMHWPRFYLVCRADETDLSPTELANFTPQRIELSSPLGASLMIQAYAVATNATQFFEAMQRGGGGVGQWGGEATTALEPGVDEGRDQWLGRVSLDRPTLARHVKAWRRSGGNLQLFKAVGAASGRIAIERPIEWIVPGLIPRGYVSLFVGTKQAGKSTLLGEMLAVVDSECTSPRHVLGAEVTARGASILVSGEDGIDFIASRNRCYEPVHGEAQGLTFVTAEKPWKVVLDLIYEIPREPGQSIDLIGIDGLRAVMPGDEDSSGATSQFFDELNALAQHHNCAIVLIHHLSKGNVRSLSSMLPAVRGSGAITDRVRVAIGMIDRGSGITEVGIIKHNIPPSESLWGELNAGKLFRRDAATLTLVPLEPGGRATAAPSSDDAAGAILEAVGYFNSQCVTLRRTGKHELFEQRPPQLAGMSRSTIREIVATLLSAGRLTDGAEGLRVADSAAPNRD